MHLFIKTHFNMNKHSGSIQNTSIILLKYVSWYYKRKYMKNTIACMLYLYSILFHKIGYISFFTFPFHYRELYQFTVVNFIVWNWPNYCNKPDIRGQHSSIPAEFVQFYAGRYMHTEWPQVKNSKMCKLGLYLLRTLSYWNWILLRDLHVRLARNV